MGECEAFGNPESAGFDGAWNGRVEGSGGGWSTSSFGQGRVASLKRRPLQTQAGQWNGTKTTFAP
jgi:hypothetical protein